MKNITVRIPIALLYVSLSLACFLLILVVKDNKSINTLLSNQDRFMFMSFLLTGVLSFFTSFLWISTLLSIAKKMSYMVCFSLVIIGVAFCVSYPKYPEAIVAIFCTLIPMVFLFLLAYSPVNSLKILISDKVDSTLDSIFLYEEDTKEEIYFLSVYRIFSITFLLLTLFGLFGATEANYLLFLVIPACSLVISILFWNIPKIMNVVSAIFSFLVLALILVGIIFFLFKNKLNAISTELIVLGLLAIILPLSLFLLFLCKETQAELNTLSNKK